MVSALEVFKESNLDRLYHLASKLFDEGFFNCYLTPQQFNLLDIILHHTQDQVLQLKLWKSFMDSSLSLEFIKSEEISNNDSNSNSNNNSQQAHHDNNNTTKDDSSHAPSTPAPDAELYLKSGFSSAKKLSSTIRYLLYEQAIDYFFMDDTQKRSKKNLLESLNKSDIDEEHQNEQDQSRGTLISNDITVTESKLSKAVRNEEDDFDDEDQDEDNEKDDQNNEKSQESSTTASLDQDDRTDKMDIDAQNNLEFSEIGDATFKINSSLILRKPIFPTPLEPISSTDEAIGAMVHPILGTASAIESNIEKQNELKLVKNFNKTYHTFENDLPNLVKRRKLERSNKQLEMVDSQDDKIDEESGNDSQSVNKLMSFGGAANLSLKNLLNRIEENRERLNVTDLELKNLIMDVRKNRSKWSSYNKIGQEELYEACEKVVLELRGYTEHSTAFLNRVSKREAPNYYQIIKDPMDLNTVMKKLKTFQYSSKAGFVDDLMLIWQNCLTYNSDPNHFLRVDAFAMQKKTLTLIPLIPDITVRDRAEVEKEAALAAAQNEENEETPKAGATSTRGGMSTSTTAGKKTKKSRKGAEEPEQNNEADRSVAHSPEVTVKEIDSTKLADNPNGSRELSMKKTLENEASKVPSKLPSASEDTPAPAVDEDEQEEENPDEVPTHGNEGQEDDDSEDLEVSTWKNLTSNTRFKLCAERSNLFKDNRLQMNADALFRENSQMNNFINYLDDDANVVLHKNRKYFDENDDPYLIEYDVTGGIPYLKFPGVDHEIIENELVEEMLEQGVTVDKLPRSGFLPPEQKQPSIVYQNINLMQDVRRICFKVNLIRQMQTAQFMHQSQLHAPLIERLNPKDIDEMSRLSNHDPVTPTVAEAALSKSVGAILMSTGFEASNPYCTMVLSRIAEDYFGNLVKSLNLHKESNSINKLPVAAKKPMKFKEILEITLVENGIEKPDVLYSYYKEHLFKQNRKLRELKSGLESFLRDLLRPGIQDITENQFTEDSEQFLNGDFSDAIGEDFFGFKELGLDKEFGLLTSSIPLHLLHSRLANSFSQLDSKTKKVKYEDFEEFQFPKLTKKDLPKQIGILKPYYNELLAKSQTHYHKQLKKHQQMVAAGEKEVDSSGNPIIFTEIKNEEDLTIMEDDDLPLKQRNNRPKIPPNGKITQIKKKVIANSYFIDIQDKLNIDISELSKNESSNERFDAAATSTSGTQARDSLLSTQEKDISKETNDKEETVGLGSKTKENGSQENRDTVKTQVDNDDLDDTSLF